MGDIEIACESGDLVPGGTARLVFKTWDDVSPPFTLKIKAPDGKLIMDRVIRDDLPTGRPQSAPPVTFTAADPGEYKISIRELYGKIEGEATLTVTGPAVAAEAAVAPEAVPASAPAPAPVESAAEAAAEPAAEEAAAAEAAAAPEAEGASESESGSE